MNKGLNLMLQDSLLDNKLGCTTVAVQIGPRPYYKPKALRH